MLAVAPGAAPAATPAMRIAPVLMDAPLARHLAEHTSDEEVIGLEPFLWRPAIGALLNDENAPYKRALAGNRVNESIRIRATRLDGRCEGGWSADGSPFFADVQRLRRRGELEPIVVLGADDAADDDDSEDDDHVECDGDGCGARLTGADVVFTCPEGRDYCSACRARLPKRPGGLVKTTAGARLAAAAAAEEDDDDD